MEPVMTVIHDPISKTALVEFGEYVVSLPGPFPTRDAAVAAAKRYFEARSALRGDVASQPIPD